MGSKKCLLIMPALFAGGAEKQYRYIIHELSKASNNIVVLMLNMPLEKGKQETDEFIKLHPNVEFVQLTGNAIRTEGKSKLQVWLSKMLALLKQYAWCRQYLRREPVEKVMFSYVTQLLLTPLCNRYGAKVIFNERNTGRQICDKKFKIKLLKKCHKIIANSSYAAKYIEEHTGIQVDVYNNGTEFKEIEKKAHRGINFLVPARVNLIKNQMLVVEAMQYLQDFPISVIFAGTAEDAEYMGKLRRRIDELRLQDKISMPGYVNDMGELYAVTDFVILPSYEEGTPNVLLEAYQYGIMALASDIPMNQACCMCREILFSPNNPGELANKIRSFIGTESHEMCEKIIANHKKYVVENFSMECMGNRYSELLLALPGEAVYEKNFI